MTDLSVEIPERENTREARAARSMSQSEKLLRRKVDNPAKDGEEVEGAPSTSNYLALQLALDDLCKACREGDATTITAILARGATELSEKWNINAASGNTGETALVCAVDGGKIEIVRQLVAAGADPNKPAKDGITALHSAAGFKRTEIIKFLLAKGAKPKADNDGQTPIDYAKEYGHDSLVAVFDLASTDESMEQLKGEAIPGYLEEKKKRMAAEEAKRLEKEAKAKADQREAARQAKELKAAEELKAAQARRSSVS